MDNWPEDWSKIPAWTEVDEDIYDHFLNVLPPLIMCGTFFQVSEPYTHELDIIRIGKTSREDRYRWRGKYMSFLKHDGKCWYVGINFAGHFPALEVQQ